VRTNRMFLKKRKHMNDLYVKVIHEKLWRIL